MERQLLNFTVGPVAMYPAARMVRSQDIFYFRSEEYSSLVKKTLARLSELIGNSLSDSLLYLAASGTGAMEAVVENCVNQNDKSLVINGGTFGQRFCKLLHYHERDFSSVDLAWNECLTSSHFDQYEDAGYSTLFVNLHETQTGQLYDIRIISDFCKRNGMMLVVDAISTFLADAYDMDKFGIDITIISSQKGLCLSPGASFISLSQRMLEKITTSSNSESLYFNLKDYLLNMKRGQTPYTPPVGVIYELAAMLDFIESEGGVAKWIDKIKFKCDYFRKKYKKSISRDSGLSIVKYADSSYFQK